MARHVAHGTDEARTALAQLQFQVLELRLEDTDVVVDAINVVGDVVDVALVLPDLRIKCDDALQTVVNVALLLLILGLVLLDLLLDALVLLL